jgi:O-succinylbenzoate synthase
LDEELIGINTLPEKRNLLELVKPQYIILKPALTGGFAGTKEWIGEAKLSNTGWWVTSALESNIGLNSIAQFTYSLDILISQGLGTGALFTNNIPSPLFIDHNQLFINVIASWDITNINDQHRTE